MSTQMKTFRIFISSPGDVQQERIIAKKVIAELNKTFSKYFILEPLLWEDMPLLASSSFQEGIDQIVNKYAIDVAVFILWSRLGSTLGASYVKPDGTPYQSGTEYEFDMMMEAFRKNGHPRIMVYIKDTPLKDRLLFAQDAELEEVIRQHGAVKDFIREHFHDEETGTYYAYTSFGEDASFANRLKTHLTNILLETIGTREHIIEWQGNPYVGLNSYEPGQSSIFFGREKSVNSIMSVVLGELKHGKMPSLILLGESGSGKSSIVKAGLFPMLQNLDGSQQFVLENTTPALLGEKAYTNLVTLFFNNYPQLKENPVYKEIINGISENYNFSHLEYALAKLETPTIPVLFIDQFEELFSDIRISEETRRQFLRFVRGLIETKRVFVVISIRNDFYSKFTAYADLGRIKQLVSQTYDLPPMDTTELASIVREPARMAGLEWEVGRNGNSLDMEIVNAASNIKNLPLIEFALSELYQHKSEKGILTFDAYNKIGGLKGAFTNYAGNIYDSLSIEEKNAFLDVLSHVITISSTDDKTFVRKTALLAEYEPSPVHIRVIKKMVDAHIFTSGKNVKGQGTFTIVHEMLITTWDVIKQWVLQEHAFITDNDYYEKCARHWKEAGKPYSLLQKDKESLLKAEYFYYWWHELCASSTREYLEKSFFRKGLFKKIFMGIIALFLFILTIYFFFTDDFLNYGFLRKIWTIVEGVGSAASLCLISYSYLKRGPYYKVSKIIRNVWLIFFLIQILSLVIDFSFYPEENNDAFVIGLIILLIPVLLLICINAIHKHHIRKKWAVKKFKIPLLYSIFNWEHYKIFSPFLAGIILLISLFFMMWAYDESQRNASATAHADNLFDIMEYNENSLTPSFFYEMNVNRADYLKNVFSSDLEDSTTINDRRFELARTYYYRCMPDSALEILKDARLAVHLTLKAKVLLQKGKYKEAAQCLVMPCDSLLSAIPQLWMRDDEPLDIFMMAGDNKSARQFIEAILKEYEQVKETGFMYRVKAVLSISENLDSVKENYSKYMLYRLSCDEDDPALGTPISLSSFVMANRLSAAQAQEIVDAYNLRINKYLQKSHHTMTDDYAMSLAICNAPTIPWQKWINGSWHTLQQFEDTGTWVYDLTFDEGSFLLTEWAMNDDNQLYVQDYMAGPCRFIKYGENFAFEAIDSKGKHVLFCITSASETEFTGKFVVNDSQHFSWTFKKN